ncbi:msl4096 [Mesorhizobium japonicum MAFF 303099]|uniref:Msl4096 protein n=1 Tax=Mesorhizobium japonicum (strain LMG 29417 / CECT 9101 / MAFF 303099) TaxID=266835 RepID=Q98ET1_RHILO|nr:msl4096 [Mesorhizobium japonicum MAFF 303099]
MAVRRVFIVCSYPDDGEEGSIVVGSWLYDGKHLPLFQSAWNIA